MKGRLNEKIRGRIVVLADKYKFLKKIKSKYNKLVSRGTYVDYSEWIKDKETKDRLNSILTNNDILFEACEKN
ncbi:hypothetical protein CRG86_010155 [Photobacterium leiognathi]|nr:hypothetical protein CRG86_010155 [Photobacterium leiognathi]